MPTCEALREEDPLRERVYEQLVLGVSTRKYRRSLESADDIGRTRSTGKSEVASPQESGQLKTGNSVSMELSWEARACVEVDSQRSR